MASKVKGFTSKLPKIKIPKDKFSKVFKSFIFWFLLFAMSLIVVDYVVQYLNYHASIAVVNGERISRSDFYSKLEQRYGSSIASQMINETLIFQEAEEQGVMATDEEIQEEVDKLEEQYGGEDVLNEELKSLGITREQLNSQIESSILVKKMLSDSVEITEEETQEFFEEYKENLFPDNEDITFEEAREEVEDTLIEQKLAEEVQPWLTELRDESRIQNNIDEPRPYSFLGITRDFIEELIK